MATTISQQISVGKNLKITNKEISLQRVIRIDSDTALLINVNTVLEKYYNEMKKYINTYQLNDDDVKKYEYKPYLLSYDIYGTVELVPFILRINHMVSEADFCGFQEGLKLFTSGIVDFINEIILKEKRTLNENRVEVQRDIS